MVYRSYTHRIKQIYYRLNACKLASLYNTVNHAIKTTIVRMWAIDGQLHIFSIWDNNTAKGGKGWGNTTTHGASELTNTAHGVTK